VQAELILRVDDPQLPANGQPLRLHVAGGAASVAPVQGLFAEESPVNVETDIATFSQLYAGFVCAEQARALGRLRADDATCAQLTSIFAAAPLYLHQPDWF
jgi:predicted acetyltransferase